MKYSATWKHIQCTALHTSGSQMANNNNKSQVLGFFLPVKSHKPTLITYTAQLLVSRFYGVADSASY